MRYKLGADGKLGSERAEPIAADARDDKDGRTNAKIKLIAGVLGVGFDALRQRELHRRQRRLAAIAAASVVGMIVTTGLSVAALLARSEAEEQRLVRRSRPKRRSRPPTSWWVSSACPIPSEARGNTVTAREIMDKGADRIQRELVEQPAIQATLMETIGTVYTSLGLYDPATSLLTSSLEKRRALYGERNLEVASSLERLGEVLKLKADYASAETMYRGALAVREPILGHDNADVARTRYELADLLERMGSFQAREPLFRDALELRRELFGNDSPEVAQSLEGLALNFYDQGNFSDPGRYSAKR